MLIGILLPVLFKARRKALVLACPIVYHGFSDNALHLTDPSGRFDVQVTPSYGWFHARRPGNAMWSAEYRVDVNPSGEWAAWTMEKSQNAHVTAFKRCEDPSWVQPTLLQVDGWFCAWIERWEFAALHGNRRQRWDAGGGSLGKRTQAVYHGGHRQRGGCRVAQVWAPMR